MFAANLTFVWGVKWVSTAGSSGVSTLMVSVSVAIIRAGNSVEDVVGRLEMTGHGYCLPLNIIA